MKINQPTLDLSDPAKPPFITTHNTDEFLAVLDREKKGELFIEYWEMVPRHNGAWKMKLRWPNND